MKTTFNFHIDIDVDLTVDEIWPDGDAPENPTVKDVERAFYGEGKRYRGHARKCLDDWSMLDIEECDVTISKWEPPCPECQLWLGRHKLDCSRRRPTTSSPGGGAATKESTDTAAPLSGSGPNDPTPEKEENK